MTLEFATRQLGGVILSALFASACGSGLSEGTRVPLDGSGSPTGPSGSGPVTLSTPAPVSPVNGVQLSTLRPTLIVENVTSSQQTGTRTYQFQISDRTDFSLAGPALAASFAVSVDQTGVAEGGAGRTTFEVPSDLQPTTRMYWRARVVQGSSSSDWSAPATFRTKLVGYSRPGELYDPLIHGETIGTVIGSVTFIEGKGVQLNNQNSYVRYQLPQTLTDGEFSVLAENLAPGAAGSKFKIFSMQSGTGNLLDNPYMANVQYRGALDGNPDNSISFKTLFGSFSDSRKFEPDRGNRLVRLLDPSKAYFWKWTWGSEVRLLVQEGIGGATVYNYGLPTAGSYAPSPHFAFLGASIATSIEEGSRPGVIISHVWIGNRPRPDSLGSALERE
jgi:hypothetical protein